MSPSLPRRILIAATCLAAASLLGLSACGDDNPTGTGGGTPQEQEAIAIVQEAVLPILQTLTLQNYLNLGGIPLQNCTMLGICTSGTAESCLGGTGQTITFTDCASNGQVVDGLLTIQGNQTAGGGTFDLQIDGLILSGGVSYAVEGACFTEIFTNVAVTLNGKNYSLAGTLEFCPTTAPGVGLDQQIAVPTSGVLTLFHGGTGTYTTIDFYVDGQPGDYFVYMYQGETIVATCEGNVLGGIECYDPGDYQF